MKPLIRKLFTLSIYCLLFLGLIGAQPISPAFDAVQESAEQTEPYAVYRFGSATNQNQTRNKSDSIEYLSCEWDFYLNKVIPSPRAARESGTNGGVAPNTAAQIEPVLPTNAAPNQTESTLNQTKSALKQTDAARESGTYSASPTLSDSAPTRIHVPSFWKDTIEELTGEATSVATGTYSLIVTGLTPHARYAFFIQESPGIACAVYANGVQVASSGIIGETPAQTVGSVTPLYAEFAADARGTVELAVAVSNNDHRKGGFWNKIAFGTQQDVFAFKSTHYAIIWFVTGSLIILCALNFMFFLLSPVRRQTLYFALAVFAFAVRVAVAGFNVLIELFPSMPLGVQLKLEYWGLWFSPPVYAFMLCRLFPTVHFSRKIRRVLLIGNFSVGIITTLLPVYWANRMVPLLQLGDLCALVFLTYILAKAVIQKEDGSILTLISMLVLAVSLIADLLFSFNPNAWQDSIMPLCVMVFTLLQFYLLALQQSRMYQERLHLVDTLKTLNDSYLRFVPREFLQLLQKQAITDILPGDNVEREMAISFSQIHYLNEDGTEATVPPEEQYMLFSRFLLEVSPIIAKYNGFISKFISNGFMALFPLKIEDAVYASIEIENRITGVFGTHGMADTQSEFVKTPLKLCIGVHYGKMILGTIGEENRLDDTVISDTVNTASRIEAMAEKMNHALLLSQQAYEACNGIFDSAIECTALAPLSVKGKTKPITVYTCTAHGALCPKEAPTANTSPDSERTENTENTESTEDTVSNPKPQKRATLAQRADKRRTKTATNNANTTDTEHKKKPTYIEENVQKQETAHNTAPNTGADSNTKSRADHTKSLAASRTKSRSVPPTKTLLCALAFLASFFGAHQNAVYAQTLHIQDATVLQTEQISLAGNWEFFPNQFIAPLDSSAKAPHIVHAPATWNEYGLGGSFDSGAGAGSFRLTVTGLKPHTEYAFESYDLCGTAMRLYANGVLVCTVGEPNLDYRNTKDNQSTDIAHFVSDANGAIEFVFHVSNSFHRIGGLWVEPLLAETAVTERNFATAARINFCFIGILFTLFAYHLFLFFCRKYDWASLYLSIFTLALLCRLLTTPFCVFKMYIPAMPYQTILRFEYSPLFMAPLFFFLYTRRQITVKVPRHALIAICTVAILDALIVYACPISVGTRMVRLCQMYALCVSAYVIFLCFYDWFKAHTPTTRLMLLSSIFLIIGFTHDFVASLYIPVFMPGIQFSPYAFAVFAFCQSGITARQHEEAQTEIDKLSESLKETNRAYYRFVPREFLSLLSKKNIVDVNLGEWVTRDMTLFCADIRNFTAIADATDSKTVFDLLNRYLMRIAPIIRTHGGFIEKYLGDGIIAFFPDNGIDAFKCAVLIQKELVLLRAELAKENLPRIDVGIGLHYGKIVLGTVGAANRMNEVTISKAIETVMQLESFTKECGHAVVASKTAVERWRAGELFSVTALSQKESETSGIKEPVYAVAADTE